MEAPKKFIWLLDNGIDRSGRKLIIKYDTDEDGLIDDDEKETMGQIRFVR